jgi:NADH:ubiquinone oxidoreductase subunit 3 (subunit A)
MVAIKFGLQYKDICDQLNRIGQNEYKSLFMPVPIAMCIIFLLCINIFTVLSIFELAKAKREQSSLSTVSEATLNLYIRQVQDFQYATKTFIFIVLGLNLTILPTVIFLPLSIAFEINSTAEIIEFISKIGCLNSLLNPFVYISRMRNFRQAIWDDTKRLFRI